MLAALPPPVESGVVVVGAAVPPLLDEPGAELELGLESALELAAEAVCELEKLVPENGFCGGGKSEQ